MSSLRQLAQELRRARGDTNAKFHAFVALLGSQRHYKPRSRREEKKYNNGS
jgi:hypothetical protein